MTSSLTKAPIWFWIIAALALAWNALGVMAYIADVSQTPEQLASQSQAIQDLVASRPVWATSAFAIAVVAGLLGCIGLLLRKAWSMTVFWLSLIAVLVQQFYAFGIAEMHKHIQGSLALPIMVTAVAIFLVWFAKFCRSKNWLS